MNGTNLANSAACAWVDNYLNTRTKKQLIHLIMIGMTWNKIYFELIGEEE